MPSAQAILSHLTVVANEAVAIAIAWHVVIAAAVVARLFGWRPSADRARTLVAMPIASSAAVAFTFGNPFNGTILGALALALIALASRSGAKELAKGSLWTVVPGTLMIAFGLFYPHFLATPSPLTYLYAAPVGLIPCPTLSVSIGFALVGVGLQARAWSLVLATFGVFYGLFGVVRLHVLLDTVLVIGSLALFVVALLEKRSSRTAVAF